MKTRQNFAECNLRRKKIAESNFLAKPAIKGIKEQID